MAKLGEARLGETQLAEPAELELIDDNVEERAKEVIKSAFPTHDGTTWNDILDVILYEFRVHHTIAHDVLENRYIDSADGEQLDMIGELWQVERQMFERDHELRARIKSMFPRHTSRATINEIIHTLSMLLVDTERDLEEEDLDEEDLPHDWDSWPEGEKQEWLERRESLWIDERLAKKVTIKDKFWSEPASFLVEIDQDAYDKSDVEIDQLETLLDQVSAAGVRPIIQVGALFTHAGVVLDDSGEPQYGEIVAEPDDELSGEPYGELYGGKYGGVATKVTDHDPDKGYGSLDDPMLGGEYADLINRDHARVDETRNDKAEFFCNAIMVVHGHDFPNFTNVGLVDGQNELLIDASRTRVRNRSQGLTGFGDIIAPGERLRVARASFSGEGSMRASAFENYRSAGFTGTATMSATATIPGYGSDYSNIGYGDDQV